MRSTVPVAPAFRLCVLFFGLAVLSPAPTDARQAPAPAPAAGASPTNLTAKTANLGDSGIPIKISIFRWSTDAERTPLVAALDPEAQKAAAAAAASGGAGARGRGGRGARAADDATDDPAQADQDGAAQGRGGRGGRGRGGDAPAAPANPVAILTAALGKAPTVGYLWTNEVVGYSIKYAFRAPLSDGGERIILVTDRRIGGGKAGWKPTATAPATDYEFTLIEMKMDSKGSGEGKTTLSSTIAFDSGAKTLALENYAAAPAVFVNVKR